MPVQDFNAVRNDLIKATAQDNAKLRILFYNINTGTKISFVATPESMQDGYTANFNEVELLGRSAPVLVYSGGSSRTLDFSVVFHEDLLENDTDIRVFADKLRALSLPVYDSGIKVPKVYFRIGKMFACWATVNTTINYKPPVRNGRMIVAEVTFSITRLSSIPRENGLYDADPLSAFDAEKTGIDRS